MDFNNITNKNLIKIAAEYTCKEDAIKNMVKLMAENGILSDENEYLNAVLEREKQGATGVGLGLAIPHGKSKSVKKAAAAFATLKNKITDWESIEDDDALELVVLLAIPETEAGNTHIDILTSLSTKLADDDFRASLLNSKTPEELLENLTKDTKAEKTEVSSEKLVVCVTACPAGIAHTYMSAEALEKAGRKLGVKVRVEKQGAKGFEDRITDEELDKACGAIFATAVSVKERERFNGLEIIEVGVAEPLKRAAELVEKASTFTRLAPRDKNIVSSSSENTENEKISFKEEAKRALLTGISYIVPLIVAGGTVLAVAVLIAQVFGLQSVFGEKGSWLWLYRQLGGGMLGTLMVPMLAGYISFSIAEKPGLAPGIAGGIAANLISSGFIGGVVGGFIAGYTMKFLKNNLKVNKNLNGFLMFYLYPVIGTLVTGSLMLFVVGKPVAAINMGLTNWLNGLTGTNAALLGAVIGAFVSFDLGGPVNKAAYAFCIGAMANGNFIPYAAFSSVKMVSAFTATLATTLKPKYYSEEEIEAGKSTWLLGLAGITEGAIPMMIEDPFRVIPAFISGSLVTGAIVAMANIGLQVPGAGIISMLVLEPNSTFSKLASAGIWLGAALVGTAISTVVLTILKAQRYNKKNNL